MRIITIIILFISGISITYWSFETEYTNLWELNTENFIDIQTSYKKSLICWRNSIFSLLWFNINKNSDCQIINPITQYPWCNTPNYIAPNGQIVSMCNIWSSQSWDLTTLPSLTCNGSIDWSCNSWNPYIWTIFQWWRNTSLLTSTQNWPFVSESSMTFPNLFITNSTYPYDWITPQNNNLWWGWTTTISNGTYSSVSWSDKILMKWPCSPWYHIPTIKEWSDLVYSINPSFDTFQNGNLIRNTLKLSPTTVKVYNNWGHMIFWDCAVLMTSTPNSVFAHKFSICNWTVNLTNDITQRGYWHPIRCFKN